MPPSEKFVVYNLRETYHELGEYEFKIVLSPRHFKNSHLSEMTLHDSDGKPMSCQIKKWGRKMNCLFKIDQSVADGVSNADIVLKEEGKDPLTARLTFWVIKP